MFAYQTYWMWTNGRISSSVTIGLNPSRRYLVTGALVGKWGGDYGQVYISTVCIQSGGQILCGVRDNPVSPPITNISHLGVVEVLQSATRVTLVLRGDGGLHRAEGVLYDIT